MRSLLAAVVLFGACSTQVTVLDVTVAGSLPVDQLRFYGEISTGQVDQVAPASATPLQLPYTFTAYMPDRAEASAQVAVEAYDSGAIIGSGLSSMFSIAAHEATPASVTLAARCNSTACTGTELFCDGFEDGLTAWSSTTGMPTNTSIEHCDGASALDAAATQATYVTKTGLTLPSTVYARVHMFLASTAAQPAFSLLSFGGPTPLVLSYDPAQGGFLATYGSVTVPFTGALPTNRWTCIKVEARFDTMDGLVAMSVDDAEYARFDALALAAPSNFTSLSVGLVAASSAVPLYVDDVAIGSSPLPCD